VVAPWCWGNGVHGRRGDGTFVTNRPTPRQVLAAEESEEDPWDDWTGLAARGGGHTCGTRQDHTLWCWGGGYSGKLGDGTLGEDREAPVLVLAAGEDEGGATWDDWTRAAAGPGHTCGIRADGSLWCWGRADSGELGDDNASTDPRPTPVEVELPTEL
jgi:alpha-tubulin suppressor-like RCC1 family protein